MDEIFNNQDTYKKRAEEKIKAELEKKKDSIDKNQDF